MRLWARETLPEPFVLGAQHRRHGPADGEHLFPSRARWLSAKGR